MSACGLAAWIVIVSEPLDANVKVSRIQAPPSLARMTMPILFVLLTNDFSLGGDDGAWERPFRQVGLSRRAVSYTSKSSRRRPPRWFGRRCRTDWPACGGRGRVSQVRG